MGTEPAKLTDSEKLDLINLKIKRIERNSYIHITVVLLGFLGILSLGALVEKAKQIKVK